MPSVWFYQSSGEQHGPISSSELKQLAASGKLLPVDQVKKGGMEKWQPASRVKGLTFGEQPREDASPKQLKDELNRLAVTTRSAGSLVTKQTTKAKLVNVTLPKAYRELGEEIYGKSEHRDEFPVLYSGIDEVNQTLSQLSNKSSEASPDETLSGRANALFDSAKRGVNRTIVEQRRSKLLGDLGRAAYEKYGASAGTNGPVIKETLTQIELLGTETAELSKSSSDGLAHAVENPLVVGLSLLLCFPLGLFLVWRHPVWSRNQKLVWTGAWCGLMVVGAMLPDDKEPPRSDDSQNSTETDFDDVPEWEKEILASEPSQPVRADETTYGKIRTGMPQQEVEAFIGSGFPPRYSGDTMMTVDYGSGRGNILINYEKKGDQWVVWDKTWFPKK